MIHMLLSLGGSRPWWKQSCHTLSLGGVGFFFQSPHWPHDRDWGEMEGGDEKHHTQRKASLGQKQIHSPPSPTFQMVPPQHLLASTLAELLVLGHRWLALGEAQM